MHAVVFAGGEYKESSLSKKAIKDADIVIAADGGAMHAISLGIFPNVVIGDFDSLPRPIQKKLERKKVQLIKFQKEKDETDTELAIIHAEKIGATQITLLGAISGDRIDHILANIMLSTVIAVPLKFIQGNQVVFVAKGPSSFTLSGKKNDLLSLIPLHKDASGITSKNLQYALNNSTLFFGKPRGVSNVFLKNEISISLTKGHLLVVWTSLDKKAKSDL